MTSWIALGVLISLGAVGLSFVSIRPFVVIRHGQAHPLDDGARRFGLGIQRPTVRRWGHVSALAQR